MNTNTPDVCPECGQAQEPGSLHLQWDWRRCDRPRLEDKLPESIMCLQCFHSFQDQYGPLAPSWDAKGNKISHDPAGRLAQFTTTPTPQKPKSNAYKPRFTFKQY